MRRIIFGCRVATASCSVLGAIVALGGPSLRASAQEPPVITTPSWTWSGWGQRAISSVSKYSYIQATWVVPSVADQRHGAEDSDWIGIGGGSTHPNHVPPLMQIGTSLVVGASPAVTAFYENAPGKYFTVRNVHPEPDNRMTAYVMYVGRTQGKNDWQFSMTDDSNGETSGAFLVYDKYKVVRRMVEAVHERVCKPAPKRSGDCTHIVHAPGIGFSQLEYGRNSGGFSPLSSLAKGSDFVAWYISNDPNGSSEKALHDAVVIPGSLTTTTSPAGNSSAFTYQQPTH
jgi:hypothetical protein